MLEERNPLYYGIQYHSDSTCTLHANEVARMHRPSDTELVLVPSTSSSIVRITTASRDPDDSRVHTIPGTCIAMYDVCIHLILHYR